jgi:hypothetical protein
MATLLNRGCPVDSRDYDGATRAARPDCPAPPARTACTACTVCRPPLPLPAPPRPLGSSHPLVHLGPTRRPAGRTALFVAAVNGRTDAARLLLAAGADPNARNSFGSCPLLEACLSGHEEVAELLFAAGARPLRALGYRACRQGGVAGRRDGVKARGRPTGGCCHVSTRPPSPPTRPRSRPARPPPTTARRPP